MFLIKTLNLSFALILWQRLIEAENSSMDEEYYRAFKDARKMAGQDGIDSVLEKYKLDALILPAEGKLSCDCNIMCLA
jgi:hypothetical protein